MKTAIPFRAIQYSTACPSCGAFFDEDSETAMEKGRVLCCRKCGVGFKSGGVV